MMAGTARADSFDDLWMGRIARPPADGVASSYSDKWLARQRRMNPRRILCAHRTEKFDRVLVVTNQKTGKSIACPVEDRGPYYNGRVLDLSPAANKALGCDGLCEVKVRRKGFD